MTTDPSFHMIVEDVFMIRGRGTVVTGKIDIGTLRVGDQVVVKGSNGQKTTTVTGIEAFRKALDQANAGDNVGLLLKDLSKQDVQHGDEILGPQNDFTWNP
jgi:elongation factor Tu